MRSNEAKNEHDPARRTVQAVMEDSVTFDGRTVALVVGNIVAQPDIDAVVNAANANLLPGGGVAGAIHRAAGPGLARECRPLAPISPGQAVITSGHQLPNRYVIHCLGPVYGQDRPEDELLAACYRNALELADRHGLTSVAFPAISTGAFGYPMEAAAEVALGTVLATITRFESVGTVRFVLADQKSFQLHSEVLRRIAGR
ncbi:macro domain-containing protein [Mycobacterium sp.]|uniref:macro domain-containing protein n=1 Tax=Mycobacterium sp. TaxID=1785 RepID=UPI0025D39949|nr:macro domain-containing protein [Mycobacterium sp.]